METTFFEKHAQNALIGAIITSILALLTGIVSIWLTVHFNDLAQVRQLRLEQITKFDQSGQQIVEAASAFIVAINDKDSKALGSARLKLNAVLAGQAHDTENIARFFDQQAKKKAKDYQSALEELSQIAQRTNDVTEMRLWAETFGRVLDSKSNLSRELYTQLGAASS